jgi:hypothetical protein
MLGLEFVCSGILDDTVQENGSHMDGSWSIGVGRVQRISSCGRNDMSIATFRPADDLFTETPSLDCFLSWIGTCGRVTMRAPFRSQDDCFS